jgi:hypothetical protein
MLDAVRRPEYTGANRCWPCTIVNTVLAFAGALGAGVTLADAGTAAAAAAGAAVLAVSMGLIYLRGYLVPGTPTLTKRYMPASVLALFGKGPAGAEPAGLAADDTGAESAAEDGIEEVDVERFLLDVEAVEPCEDRDDLCLTDGFREAWNAEVAAVRDDGVDAETVVSTLGLPVEEAEIDSYGDAYVLKSRGRTVGKWPSEAALVADSAGATVLADRSGDWAALVPRAKGQVLNGLRLFLVDCPTGEGGVEFGQETVESCCSTREVVAVTCEETGERLFEQPVPE